MPAPFKVVIRDNGYSVVDHPGSVAVIPVLKWGSQDLKAGQAPPCAEDSLILLCSQHRAGPECDVIEIPAGTCDVAGEALSMTGVREMVEEIGHKPSHIASLGTMLPSPGFCSEVIHLYLAWGLEVCPGEREFEPITLSVGHVVEQISDGTITDAKTIVALTKWGLLTGSLKPMEVED
jgi:ADP-ribose pyrophosphatase